MDDEFGGDDVDFNAALAIADHGTTPTVISSSSTSNNKNSNITGPRPVVKQPTPQSLGSGRAGPSSILVSPRQKGNPILNNIRSMPWEYSDIPADFVLGTTTCALFLSLKYHRLHPEYIYSRIRVLAGKFALRIVLVMVDIENHEDPLKELSKTSLINNVTLILTWSAQEAGRYLELFKSYEHAAPTSIKAQQSLTYSDNLVEFVTIPRSINKTDAVGLVSNFGSVRTAVNAQPEDISLIAGWGEKKVKDWCTAVREPFKVQRSNKAAAVPKSFAQPEPELDAQIAARLGIGSAPSFTRDSSSFNDHGNTAGVATRPETKISDDYYDPEGEEAMAEAVAAETLPAPQLGSKPVAKRKPSDEHLSEGVMAALNKLRKT